jgi:osmotically-inducible protein OsmY
MRPDSEIRRDVEAELRWSPDIDDRDVAIRVHGGVVRLTGSVHSHAERRHVESKVKRIAGVIGVANDIQVRLPSGNGMDSQIAREAVMALKRALPTAYDRLEVVVRKGEVVLQGRVEWPFQRDHAGDAVRALRGVTGVRNLISVEPFPSYGYDRLHGSEERVS